jgi:hypothetical protein
MSMTTIVTKRLRLWVAGFAMLAIGLAGNLLVPQAAHAYGATLAPGESIRDWGKLESPNGQFALIMQTDGNLVAYTWPHGYWASNTGGAGTNLVMQGDGNLVIYDNRGVALWASHTNNNPGAYLVLQDDGNMVIRRADGLVIWSPNMVQTRLHSGQSLQGNRSWTIYSPDRRYRMVMQTDGNAVLYDRNVAIWAKHGAGPNATLEMQTDGNLVLYNQNHTATWASNQFGPNGSYLEGQNDGNFVVYTPSRGVLWSTRADSTPTGTRQQLAQQILNHTNITRPGRCVTDDLVRTAQGQTATNGSWLSERMLINTLELARDRRIQITAITSCGSGHSSTSNHYRGTAIDLIHGVGNDMPNIAATTYHNRGAWNINELIFDPMPQGTNTLLNGNHHQYSASTLSAHRDHVHFSTK